MKTCPGCGQTLALDQFNFKNRHTGRRQVYCRSCSSRYLREHYARNTAYYIAKARSRNRLVRTDSHERIMAYLREHACVDCGETDVVVLQFDHTDPSAKRLEISMLVKNNFAWQAILAEIRKCEVRCANCHLRRTAQQFGWYRLVRPAGVEPTTLSSED